jgi:hypothetical protein
MTQLIYENEIYNNIKNFINAVHVNVMHGYFDHHYKKLKIWLKRIMLKIHVC